MENKFTEKAEKVLSGATAFAEGYGHTYIGSEHLLRALANDGLSCAAVILEKNGVTPEKLDGAIREYSGKHRKTSLNAEDMTPRCRKIIENAYKNSLKYASARVGTEHILLALLEERDSMAMKLLDRLGIDVPALRDEVTTFLRVSEKAIDAGSKKSDPSAQSLAQYGKDLTRAAENGKIDPVIGREQETDRLIRVLCRRTKNNPCLIGEAGVGKTAIVEGLAAKIASGEIPPLLRGKKIISVDLTAMVAGAKYRGDFEERIKNVLAEAQKNKEIILFIDEIHTIVGAGSAEGAIDAANILKPELSRGEIRIIGATTPDEYRRYIEKDPALERRFQPITVEEASVEMTVRILKGLRPKYERHHGLSITDDALVAAAELSERYLPDRRLPDKAIDLLDETCAKMNIAIHGKSDESTELDEKIRQIREKKECAVLEKDYSLAISLRDLEVLYRAQAEEVKAKNERAAQTVVDGGRVRDILTEMTGIPIPKPGESGENADLEEKLNRRVLGQKAATSLLAGAVMRSKAGINDPGRPRGIFLFLGESGVGKTALAKALAAELFGSEKSLIRFDMSEYMEQNAVTKLIGSPPGYIGYDEGGKLTESVRRHPYSVVLFDEIEKAHRDVLNLLLQINDDGRLTDAQGRTVNFKNAFIIMTSNVGADTLRDGAKAGFLASEGKEDALNELLKKYFRPEFLNRIDEIVPFQPLSLETLREIAKAKLSDLSERLSERGYTVEFSEEVSLWLAAKSKKKGYGARPLGHLIAKEIETGLSRKIVSGEIPERGSVTLTVREGKPVILTDRAAERDTTERKEDAAATVDG